MNKFNLSGKEIIAVLEGVLKHTSWDLRQHDCGNYAVNHVDQNDSGWWAPVCTSQADYDNLKGFLDGMSGNDYGLYGIANDMS